MITVLSSGDGSNSKSTDSVSLLVCFGALRLENCSTESDKYGVLSMCLDLRAAPITVHRYAHACISYVIYLLEGRSSADSRLVGCGFLFLCAKSEARLNEGTEHATKIN